MRNKFPGTCGCGGEVAVGGGTIHKREDRWVIVCDACGTLAEGVAKPGRVLDSMYFWPNGAGATECTKEYADVCFEMHAAQRELNNLDEKDPGYATAYNRYGELCHKVDQMLADGHIGERIPFNSPDPSLATPRGL